MTLNLIKLCVGAESIEDLAAWQAERLASQAAKTQTPRLYHTTFQRPKREAELLDGGSLYWVIKGVVQVRQRLVGFDEGTKENGQPCCLLLLDPALIAVRPMPRRAFQGWRYLPPEDAPPDVRPGARGDDMAAMPSKLRKELAELGLL